jgi:hypothetical protein
MPRVTSQSLPLELRTFVDTERWTYAKTMPRWPHEYIVRDQVDATKFVALVRHIREHGYLGHFYKKPITYFDEGGMTYWTMGAPVEETIIINRCKTENTFEQRKAEGRLPNSDF